LRPLAVLTALVFGSSAAISFGLTATTIVFFVLRVEQPQLDRELPSLVRSCLCFLALAAVSGGCLYATLKDLRWRNAGQAGMWIAVTLVAYAYWPK
jgi:hypothetical protein